MSKFKIISLLLGLGILSLLIYLSDWRDVIRNIGNADLAYIAAGILLTFLLMLLKALRWRFLLRKVGIDLPIRKAWYILMAGLFISNLTPGRIGEPVRSYILKRREGTAFSKSLPSVLVERMFDILAIILLAVPGITILSSLVAYRGIMVLVAIIYILLILFIILIGSNPKRISAALKTLYRFFGWIPCFRKFESRIESMALNFHRSLLTYKDRGTLLFTLSLSVMLWSVEGLILMLSFNSLGMNPGLLPSIGIFSIAMLIAIISSLPGGIGSMEATMVLFFVSTFDFTVPMATAAVLIYRAVSLWLNLLVGGICFSLRS